MSLINWESIVALAGAAALTASAVAMRRKNKREHGLYWDIGRSWTLQHWPRLTAELKQLGIDYIVVNTNGSEAAIAGKADGRWTAEQLGQLDAAARGPQVRAMVWAAPTRKFADDFARYCRRLRVVGIRVVELDIERDAWGTLVKGFKSREEAAAHLLRVARDAGLTVGVTMIPDRLYGEFATADYVSVQAYSRNNKGAANHGYGATYGPGGMQERAYTGALRLRLPWVCGLAAYDQHWKDDRLSGLKGMRIAYDAAANRSKSICWWSAKWVLGHRQDPQVRAEIARLIRRNS